MSNERRGGFTLIEVMVVIVVITLLAAMVSPNIFRNLGAAKEGTARAQMEMLAAALDAYRLAHDQYPSTEDGLAALWNPPEIGPALQRWQGPYLRKPIPQDPWDHDYVYRYPGERIPTDFDLLSLGADGEPGGERESADILAWE